MTRLSLNNPIAILMVSLALIVFSAAVVPRMSIDTFPELTPPVLVVGTLAPGLGPKDVEKTITWRIEKYVSATPGVDHVQSVSRNEPMVDASQNPLSLIVEHEESSTHWLVSWLNCPQLTILIS